jgi:hypothetical protein
METVVLVNAAPGYEERVASALQDEDGVAGIAAVQQENFNMAILLQVDGPNKLQKFLTNTLMFVSGVQGAELDKDPSDELMDRLESEGPGRADQRGGGRGPPGPGEPGAAGPGGGPAGGGVPPGEDRPGGIPGEGDDEDEDVPGGIPGRPDREPTTGQDPGGRTPGGRTPGGHTPGSGGHATGGGAPQEDEEDIPGIDETDIPSPGEDRDVGGPRDPDPRELRGEKDEDEDD